MFVKRDERLLNNTLLREWGIINHGLDPSIKYKINIQSKESFYL